MDFRFTEEQKMLKKSAREFLTAECPKSVVRTLEASGNGHSPELWARIARLGWNAIMIPEQYGGAGWGLVEQAVLFEEIGRAAVPLPLFATLMGTLTLLEGGSGEQLQSFLPKVATGNLILTTAFDEPGAVYNPSFTATRAAARGLDYSIHGTKVFVPYPDVADYMLAAVRTGGKPGGPSGVSMFAIPKGRTGLRLSPIKTIAVDRQFQVDLEGVSASQEEMIGRQGHSVPAMHAVLEKATAIQCAEILGGALSETEVTAEYTKQRVQFARPIGTFQAVQHRLADMFIDVQSARWTTYQAVWRLSQGLPAGKELSIAKFITARAGQRVAFSAQQLHGGIGVDLDADLHFYYRRAKALELTLGTPAAHLEALESHLGM